ncbi:MAG: 2-amino-4-hydroxy-6-hydroxymethyldihydropteridine diphosphokinase [Firmicutes bacterium]|jgi:2-amino-4-hydroxy-6-hydroxymethyldihydropteridine diphosphokinase|nr:2-amino-4-hydroxy-6-hydroxymethyldihydropteridine diphosphokinase [Bacillota bacterium]
MTGEDGRVVTAYVGLGSNMGDRVENMCRAIEGMDALDATAVQKVSSLYETLPWGGVEQGPFLNAVAQLRTSLPPMKLLSELLALEQRLGRTRSIRWGPRVIDLDLLLYGNLTICTELLQVPHPRMTERAFVLVPLVEIAPDVVVRGRSAREYLSALQRSPDDVVKRSGKDWHRRCE